MSDQSVTIRHLLIDFPGEASGQELKGLADDGQMLALESNVADIPGLVWNDVSEEISDSVKSLLDVELSDVVLGGWAKYQGLRKFRDKSKYPPNETVLAPLARHRITSSHEPFLEILVDNEVKSRIEFRIDLMLNIEGGVLKIRDGKIWGAKSGSCQCSGKIACGPIQLLEKKLQPFELEGAIDFSRGIPIP